jgi:hypothetical protein
MIMMFRMCVFHLPVVCNEGVHAKSRHNKAQLPSNVCVYIRCKYKHTHTHTHTHTQREGVTSARCALSCNYNINYNVSLVQLRLTSIACVYCCPFYEYFWRLLIARACVCVYARVCVCMCVYACVCVDLARNEYKGRASLMHSNKQMRFRNKLLRISLAYECL